MLVLTRKIGEEVVIGEAGDIRLTIIEIGRGKVKIGFQAPRDVRIMRTELKQQVAGDNTDLEVNFESA